jgi:hypothetical protein
MPLEKWREKNAVSSSRSASSARSGERRSVAPAPASVARIEE